MVLRLRSEAHTDMVREHLQHVESPAINVRSVGHTGADLLTDYLQCASESVRLLRHNSSAEYIDRLVLTRSWALQGSTTATFTR